MGWQEIQEEALRRFPRERKGWLEKNVDLECPDLRKMTTAEIRARFPGDPKDPEAPGGPLKSTVNDARLIRTFIWQSWLKIKAGELKPVKGNLRSFWYRDLQPFYKHHGLLVTDEGPALHHGDLSVVKRFMERLAGGVRGISRFFGAADRGAAREFYLVDKMGKSFDEFVVMKIFRFQDEFEFKDPRENFWMVGRRRPRLIFFTEKEGLYWLCKEIAKRYGISVMASQGEPGYLTLEYFTDALRAYGVRVLEVAVLTDYDPWGYNIAKEFVRKLEIFGFKVRMRHLTSLDLFTPEVIEYAKRDLSKVSPSKKKQVEEWMKETGGINGEPYGMHIDHAEFDRIRDAVDKWHGEVSGKKGRKYCGTGVISG